MHPSLPIEFVELAENTPVNNIDAFNCSHCNCTALSLNSLNKHWNDTHKASKLPFIHRKTNFPVETDYECFWCRKRGDVRSLNEHCMSDHNSKYFLFRVVNSTKSKYKCSECCLIFNSVDILKRHFAMDHPAEQFTYVIVNKTEATASGSVHSYSNQSRQIPSYKCFCCHFVSPMYWVMVKHLHTHFVTFACVECDALFTTMHGIRKHIMTTHPGSLLKPSIIKGTERDIENAKTHIIIIGEGGIKRKITNEELIRAEKEEKIGEQSLEMYTYDDPLPAKVKLPMKDTARKSTSHLKKVSKQLEQPKIPLTKKVSTTSRTVGSKESLNDVFAVLSCEERKVKLPAVKVMQMLNFKDKFVLDDAFQRL